MKIYILWRDAGDGDVPWIVDAVDEYTIEEHCDFPPEYKKKRAMTEHRELIINIPESAVRALFESPGVEARVLPPEPTATDETENP